MIPTDKCAVCVTEKTLCNQCRDNPKYANVPSQSLFQVYQPTCPFGATDCVCDPAYIKYYHPEWYKDMYGDKSPSEVANETCKRQTSMRHCYDDEDK